MVRRIHRIVLLFALLVGCAGMSYVQAAVYSGSCGTNATWSLNTINYKLTISGSGAMTNYTSSSPAPWDSYKKSILTISIANTITSIGDYAFAGCTKAALVSIGTGVKSIGSNAFSSCSFLSSVTIPNGVTTIGNAAFYNCPNLIYVSIPSSVTSLGSQAFYGCTKLTWISIPNSVTKLGTYTLSGSGIVDIYVYWTTTSGDHCIPVWTTGFVTKVPQTAVTLHVPCGTRSMYMGLTGWRDFTVVEPQYTITAQTNNSSYGTVKIDDGTAGADVSKTVNCATNVTLTAVTTTSECNIDFLQWNDGNKDNPRTITAERSITYTAQFGTIGGDCGASGNNLTWAFSRCTGVLTISGTGAMVDYTGTEAPWYQYKASIRTVVVEEGVTTIGSHAFNQIQKITTVSFPNTLISVGDYAFWGGKLTSLPLPNSLVSIGNSAFAQNRATSLAIGSNVTSIGDNAFGVGSNLASIGVDPGNTVFDSREDCNALIETSSNTLVKGCKNTIIPNTVTSLNISAFAGNTQLTSITIPGSIAVIPNRAFSACTALASVVLEEGVQTINNEAFLNCTPLATVKLPSSLRNLGQRAFIGNSLTDMYVAWTENIPGWPFQFSIKTANLHVPCGTEAVYQAADGWKDYNIIDEIVSGTCGAQGNNVRWTLCDGTLYISGTGAMSNYPGLNMPWKSHRASITSVVISDGVTSIGYNAFNGCSNLTSVTIPPSVTSIEQNAFYGCYAMESLYITDLAAWCNVEFGVSVEATPFMRNNYNSGSTEYLGGGNLYLNGTLVTTLTIPDGITEIKNLTFLGCSSITSIDFNQVTTIGSASFKGCHGLTSVTLPEGVTSLKNAFPYCTQLQSISIPASLTSLASQTLYHSDALTDIYVYWTDDIPGWPQYFTAQSPQPSITLHVPCGTEELYNTKANWKKYHIEAEGTNTVTVQAADPTMGDVSITVN